MRETWYKIYKLYCKELGVEYPLKQSELSIKTTNKIRGYTNSLEFYIKNNNRDELNEEADILALTYYYFMKKYGEDKFYNMIDNIFKKRKYLESNKSYNISLRTIISILYVSGYRDDTLKDKIDTYLITNDNGDE